MINLTSMNIKDSRVIHLKDIEFSHIYNLSFDDIGLSSIKNSNKFIYQSRPYNIINYTIEPIIYLTINRDIKSIKIIIDDFLIKNIGFLNQVLKIYISVLFIPSVHGISISREINLIFSPNINIFPFKQISLEKLITIISSKIYNRFDKTLISKCYKVKNMYLV